MSIFKLLYFSILTHFKFKITAIIEKYTIKTPKMVIYLDIIIS